MSLNKVMLIGNVGQDPNVRTLENGKVASISFATSERYKDRNGEQKEVTEWHNVQVWGKTAEFVENYVHKGDQLFVEGQIRSRKYTDRDGVERSVTEIRADNVQRIGGQRRDDANPQPSRQTGRPAPRQQAPAPAPEPENFQDDLPF